MDTELINLNKLAADLAEIADAVATISPDLANRIRVIRADGMRQRIEYIPTKLPMSDWAIIRATGILKAQANR